MSHNVSTLTLGRLQAIGYRSVSDTESGRRRRFPNALVIIDADVPGGTRVRGLGEAPFRGRETGNGRGHVWQFLEEALDYLAERQVSTTDRVSALNSVRCLMSDLARIATRLEDEASGSWSAPRNVRDVTRRTAAWSGLVETVPPFRGALYGIETALLDVVARAMQLSVAELLGGRNGSTTLVRPISAGHLSGAQLQEAIREAVETLPPSVPLWVDFQRQLPYGQALSRLRSVTKALAEADSPREVVLRRPLRLRDTHRKPGLHRAARQLVKEAGGGIRLTFTIDAGASGHRWNMLASLFREQWATCVRPSAAGGLLPALQALRAAGHRADGRSFVVGVEAGSAISDAALHHLAAAAGPTGQVAVVSEARHGLNEHPSGPGLGVTPPWNEIVDSVTDHLVIPREQNSDEAQPMNTYREVPFLRPLGPNGTKGHLLEREALALGLSTTRYSKGAFTATDGVHDPLVFKWSRGPLSSAVSLAMCTHKEATRIRLHRAGVPVPRGRTFRNGDFATARAFADELGFPVVVKPAMGVRGIGVVAGIRDRNELELAFEQLSDSKLGAQDFIVEKHIPGQDYRIVVVGDRVVAAILREPASVLGDGVRSIAELWAHKNAARRLNPHLWGRPIMNDAAARYQLTRAGLTLESVPAQGQRVMLSNSNSLSQGGDSTDILDEMHPSIVEASIAAVRAIPGLAFCGVDFLLEDHTKPLSVQESGICELNAHAAIGNCEYPFYGKPRQVAKAFMEECIKAYDLDVSTERADQVALRLTVRGRVSGVGYRAWMRRHARDFEMTGWVRNVNRRTVEAVIAGETMAATALAAAAVLGPRRARPTSVTTEHVSRPAATDFSVVSRPPQELPSVR